MTALSSLFSSVSLNLFSSHVPFDLLMVIEFFELVVAACPFTVFNFDSFRKNENRSPALFSISKSVYGEIDELILFYSILSARVVLGVMFDHC